MICCLNPNCDRPLNSDCHAECQNCGSSLKARLRNRYQVTEPLGRGGFGKTYLAKDTDKLDEICVVKQLAFNGTETKALSKAKDLFFLEAQQLQRLGEHPQIPHLLAYFEEDNYLYLVQQYIEGKNLAERLKLEGVYNESEIKNFLGDILPVFQFIHDRGVIHRDVKPTNIIYNVRDNKYVLIDFGVTKVMNASQGNTPGTSIGSQGYAAIEQYKGNALPASDLYSLGVCCFCLMSGISPYHLWLDRGYSWVENWQKSIKISLSPELEGILNKLLQKDYNKRYQRADRVLKDLRKIEGLNSEIESSLVIELDFEEEMFSSLSNSKEAEPEAEITYLNTNPEIKPTQIAPQSSSREGKNGSINKLKISLLASFGIALALLLVFFSNRQQPVEQTKLSKQVVEKPSQPNQIQLEQIITVPSGLFNYGGSTTWAGLRAKVYPAIQAKWPEYQLRYLDPINANPGSSIGIKMLLDDQLSFSLSSRPLRDKEYQQAQLRGYNLEQVPVAIDAIAIAVHPDLQVPGLTVAELADIYTGKITNWQQVGGPNLEIVPYSRHLNEGGTVEFFVKNVLKKQNFAANVIPVPDTTRGIRRVIATPGAIYYASASQIVSQCRVKALPIGRDRDFLVSPYRQPILPPSQCNAKNHNHLNKQAFINDEYPITRRLFVIIRKDGREDELAGRTYAKILSSNWAQKIIDEAGFIGIYDR